MKTDVQIVKAAHTKTKYTEEDVRELTKCSHPVSGPVYFITNYVYVQNVKLGRVKFNLYPYQYELINNYHNYRYSVSLCSRQLGKSTIAAAYLLWYAMFNDDATILVASNKHEGAMEIMHRIRYAYENLPDFIRAGAASYNKKSIEFDNGSRIISQATTENTGRGLSLSLVYCLGGENTVTVRDKETKEIKEISLSDLYEELSESDYIQDIEEDFDCEFEIIQNK